MEIHKLVRYAKEMGSQKYRRARGSLHCASGWSQGDGYQPHQTICSSGHLESGKPQPTQEWDAVQEKRESNHPEVGVSAKGK